MKTQFFWICNVQLCSCGLCALWCGVLQGLCGVGSSGILCFHPIITSISTSLDDVSRPHTFHPWTHLCPSLRDSPATEVMRGIAFKHNEFIIQFPGFSHTKKGDTCFSLIEDQRKVPSGHVPRFTLLWVWTFNCCQVGFIYSMYFRWSIKYYVKNASLSEA